MPRLFFAVAAMLCALACPAGATQPPKCNPADKAPLVGAAAAVDGDTLAVIVSGARTPNIRLWGVDAPELRDTGKV